MYVYLIQKKRIIQHFVSNALGQHKHRIHLIKLKKKEYNEVYITGVRELEGFIEGGEGFFVFAGII